MEGDATDTVVSCIALGYPCSLFLPLLSLAVSLFASGWLSISRLCLSVFLSRCPYLSLSHQHQTMSGVNTSAAVSVSRSPSTYTASATSNATTGASTGVITHQAAARDWT